MKLIFLLLLGVLAFSAEAQTGRFVGKNLVIKDGNTSIKIPIVSDSVVPPEAPYVHAVLKRHGEYFVVITTHEWSHGAPADHGECGAGVESYVKWLHIVDGKVTQNTSGCYESCLENRDGEVTGWRGSLFIITTEGYLENDTNTLRTITFTFDAHHPEQGVKEDHGERSRAAR